jgi:CheY-like chemotaxis protein
MPGGKRPIRVLVVDDQADTAESFARLLQLMGCAATFVTDPAKAMDAAAALEAELIFLDVGMHGITGYELARLFRQRYGERVRLVAVTAYGSDAHRAQSRQAGFDAHVVKPVDNPLVESMLVTVLSSRA